MILLVAEKPSVATGHYRTMLERCAGESFVQGDGFLRGKEHCISWCVGHLVTLSPFDKYDGYEGFWKLGNLPLLPDKFKLEAIERTQKQLRVLTELSQEADILVNGADAGREGNLIFDLVLDFTPELKKKTIQRLWVNSFVDKDLDYAWTHLETAEQRQNLSYAARLRQRADWLVGLNATRAYTLTAGRGKLMSVGRVQTPTLNLVVTRDEEVEGFQELFFYGVTATWKGYTAQWMENDKLAFHDGPVVPERVIKKCQGKPVSIDAIKKSTKRTFPKKPFDLTELQKEGNKRYKIKVARVLEIAQSLYEDKFITYPRTDSAYLTEGMRHTSHALAQSLATDSETALMRPVDEKFSFINDKKVTDHFAIIPTDVVPQNLPLEFQQIYSLVRERFIHAWLQPHVWEQTLVSFSCEDEQFRMKLKQDKDMGFKAIELERKEAEAAQKQASQTGTSQDASNKVEEKASEEDGDEASNRLTSKLEWRKGDAAPFDDIWCNKKKKAKPKYFTEATLLAAMKTAGKTIEDEELAEAMKERGLGTPATQAGVIETLKRREFIVEDKNKIKSTENGRRLVRLVDEQLKSPEMTGEWEYKLTQIEKGKLSPVAFRDDIVGYVKNVFAGLNNRFAHDFEREKVKPEFHCPKCKKGDVLNLLEVRNWGYQCNASDCGFKMSHTIAEKSLSLDETRTLLDTGNTEELDGFRSRKGFYFKAALRIDEKFEVTFHFKEERKMHDRKEKCLRCKSGLRESEKSISCGNERCNFVIFKTVAGLALTPEHIDMLLGKKTTPLISGFMSKKGTHFEAMLKLDGNLKVVFDFPNDRSGKPGNHKQPQQSNSHSFSCPACGTRLQQNRGSFYCDDARCGFQINSHRHRKKIPLEQIEKLLTTGTTEVMAGFVSPKGTPFSGRLYLDEQKQVQLDWNLEQNKALLQ